MNSHASKVGIAFGIVYAAIFFLYGLLAALFGRVFFALGLDLQPAGGLAPERRMGRPACRIGRPMP
jgi:hypothetical protein